MTAKRMKITPVNGWLLRVIRAMCEVTGLMLVAASTGVGQGLKDVGEVRVSAVSPQSIVRQISGLPSVAQLRLNIVLEGDKQKWRYVKLIALPESTEVFVDGEQTGYKAKDKLSRGVWYTFKENLQVILLVLKDNKPESKSAKIDFTLGHSDEMFAGPNPKVSSKKDYSIELYWGEAGEVSFGSNLLELQLSDEPNRRQQFIDLISKDPLWKFVQFRSPTGMSLRLASDNDEDNVTVAPGSVIDAQTWYGFRGRLRLMASCDNPELPVARLVAAVKRETRDVETVEAAKEAIRRGVRADSVPASVEVKLLRKESLIDFAIDYWPVILPVIIVIVGSLSLLAMKLVGLMRDRRSQGSGRTMRPQLSRPVRSRRIYSRSTGLSKISKPEKADDFPMGFSGFLGFGKRSEAEKPILPKLPRLEPHANLVERSSQPGDAQLGYTQSGSVQPSGSRAGHVQASTRQSDPGLRSFPDPNASSPTGQAVRLAREEPSEGRSIPAPIDAQQVRDLIGAEFAKRSAPIEHAVARVNDLITQREKVLRDEFAESVHKTHREVHEMRKRLADQELIILGLSERDTQRADHEMETRIDSHQQFVADLLLKEIHGQLADFHRVLENNLQKDDDKSDPNPLYSKLLGHLFGIKVEDLHEGVFQEKVESVNTALNEYLKTELPRAESLKDIKTKAHGIHQALCNLRDKTASLASAAIDTELRKVVEIADEIANNTDVLQSQLQNRTPALDIRLRIPVPAHEGARYTFIEELGFAIKGELDRIRDPERYYRRKLDRLVTRDLVALAELFDKQVAGGPGRNPEVEQALQSLFAAAGLRSILPREGRGELFDSAEQTLVRIIANKSGESQTVAEVVSRGFAYRDGQKEVLLRRAGVKVYR